MNPPLFRWILAACLVSLLFGLPVSVAFGADPVTVITVESTEDNYNDGNSKTCQNATPCTLRRAVNQAYSLGDGDRPVLINFDIPTTDSGYNDLLQAWKIELTGTTLNPLRDLNGKVTVDGSTQPGGRSGAPKIILDGKKAKNYGFVMRYDANAVIGLAMQNFKTAHISVAGHNNTVSDNWFGLSDDGTLLSAGDEETYEGGSAVLVSSGCDSNVISRNMFAGFWGVACSINGSHNQFTGNWVGTRANGTIPLPSGFTKHPCSSGGWVGGSGISVAGSNNQVGGPNAGDGNVFAGLFLDLSETSTQGPAIKVYPGTNHLIQNNVVGLDSAGKAVGVCGRGLDLGSGPDELQVLNNTFVETGLSAVLMNSSVESNALRSNVIKRKTQWPGAQGDNGFAEDAIAYGPMVPAALKGFKPAAVTKIDGTTVKGTSGAGSVCAECIIELFLDDLDSVKECLTPLQFVTADASGNWTANLAAALQPTQGLRTMSTVPDSFTITGLKANTTSNLSQIYSKLPKVSVTAPDNVATEAGATTGTFKFARDLAATSVTIYYKVAGSAVAGVDYTALPGKVTMAAGVKTALVKVKPKNDTKKEVNETVKVTLVDKPAYDLGTPTQATVTIKDND
ncbi:MAG TPA: hypothetical protein PLM79_05095 [Syntrophobacteraceae bacterium]|nr:hypothetical protein [Syntrophobacteraceae bacterium]